VKRDIEIPIKVVKSMAGLPIKKVNELVDLVRDMFSSFPEVSFAYLYGSASSARKGQSGLPLPRDIDVAVYVKGGDPVRLELALQMEFYKLTGLPPEVLDVRSLNKAPLSIAIKIITQGELLLCREKDAHAEFVEEVANKYRQLRGLIEVAYA